MCGIAGIFNYARPSCPVDRGLLERMTRLLAHRGPDGEGFYVNGPVGLGHRRLAIVDLTPTGAQPMSNEDATCWIAYNGEFYDHRAHRVRLSARHRFRGSSDTETLLYLLQDEGPTSLGKLSAIFGVAFWDLRRKELTLARDALGVKQLYYYDDGETVVFASEIKALLACGSVPREMNCEAVNQYLHFHTPLFEQTFFRGIKQLRPGEYLQFSLDGRRRSGYHWQLENFQELDDTPERTAVAVNQALGSIVSDQLMADVPVGTFFSGGIDSSAVAHFAKLAGSRPSCFGVHFTGQGVIDERPFQEATAKALGLDLELITLDGATFPDDLPRLMWHQDQPVIGPALLPMYYVSKLAAGHVKVCLGGQAADEIFGGYARYALTHPFRAARSLALGRHKPEFRGAPHGAVGGNLVKQLLEARTLKRLATNALNVFDWKELYFQNFANTPESVWQELIADEEVVSRETCRRIFHDTLSSSAAADPAALAMHWDLQTYLPGLFHQDDRMSMACSLESRVPLADPRIVELAFRIPFSLKIRDGATKWVLREAVKDVLPSDVLNRRKAGFDTPAESWMRDKHRSFVREVLLSTTARHRGLWNSVAITRWLDSPHHARWFDAIWKVLCIEIWAQQFLDTQLRTEKSDHVTELGSESAPAIRSPIRDELSLRDRAQELKELGASKTAFRIGWELRLRSGLIEWTEPQPRILGQSEIPSAPEVCAQLPFNGENVATLLGQTISREASDELARHALRAAKGKIRCFGRWLGDYGDPPDWQLNPLSGRRWDRDCHWTRSLREEGRVGDVKLTWEIARFPHAYYMCRAALLRSELREGLSEVLAKQIRGFISENPYGRGIHWASGQEIVVRTAAWLFALGTLGSSSQIGATWHEIAQHIYAGAVHVERYFDYSRKAVINNHLLAEALGLLIAAFVFPVVPESPRWRRIGIDTLTIQADRQIYSDGAYVQQSHNYQRVAMQFYMLASCLFRKAREPIPNEWLRAMERSLDFLFAQQNPLDGRLPNYGANDGAMPMVLSTCDFSDFRPLLQALSVLTRGERIYARGPWDEECAWLMGPDALDVPLRSIARRSISFAVTGYHVLRGDDPCTFATMRCGTLTDRFSQIDMLSLDVWWRGENVIVDSGSYMYNGPEKWHSHFLGTSSHNTVSIDNRDQMLHFRRFKSLYWTNARILSFADSGRAAVMEGEHLGYERYPGSCKHRRSVLFVKDQFWVVLDSVFGEGTHLLRLNWLLGDYPYTLDRSFGAADFETPVGPFVVTMVDGAGTPLTLTVARGMADPPRGWISRYYGEKTATPSIAVEQVIALPVTWVTVLAPTRATVDINGGLWSISAGNARVKFRVEAGRFIEFTPAQIAVEHSPNTLD